MLKFVLFLTAMALDDGSLSIWDAEKSQEYHNFPAVHSGPSTQLAFSPYNNMLVATVGIDRKLVLYDTVGKRLVIVFISNLLRFTNKRIIIIIFHFYHILIIFQL